MKKYSLIIALLSVLLSVSGVLAREVETRHEDNGYSWRLITDGKFKGAETTSGKVIVPIEEEYTQIAYITTDTSPYFMVHRGEKCGAYTIHGERAVPAKYPCVSYATEEGFMHSDSWDTEATNYPLGIWMTGDGHTTLTKGEDVETVMPDTVAVEPEEDVTYIPVVDIKKNPATEILSADDEAQQQTDNLWPLPLGQGRYSLTFKNGDKAGYLYYNPVTRSMFVNLIGKGLVREWHHLQTEQTVYDGTKMLMYTDKSTGQEVDIANASDSDDGEFIIFYPGDDGNTAIFYSSRSSFVALSPSQVNIQAKRRNE